MPICEMTEITDEIFQAFQHLIPQLTEHSLPPTREALAVMASSATSIVFLARHPDMKGEIVGSATLGTFQTLTGIHGWIEDVVVDRDARRQGLGKALTEACLSKAQEIGLREVYLTSRPCRKAANQLYQSMGFIQRKTNVYRYEFA